MSNLRDILNDIRATTGALTPGNVVNTARDESHPLHHRFEWDDAIAGEQYRLQQAGQLIRSVKLTYKETPEGEKKVRGFLPIRRATTDEVGTESAHTVYEPIEELMSDSLQRRIILRECEREVRALKAKYGHLREFAEIVAGALAA